MPILNRVDANVQPFGINSTGTNRTVFGDVAQSDDIDDNFNADFLLGWEITGVNDAPTKQDFNGLGYTSVYLSSYLYQEGIAEWNAKQEYIINSYSKGSDGNLYKAITGTIGTPNVNNNPIVSPLNWEEVVGAKLSITGTFTSTNSTNNINMIGIVPKLKGLEIGDVIQISDSISNNSEYTVEVITDDDNIIVNQAHAGGTTTKSLVNETSTSNVTIILLTKWNKAPLGLGQGKVVMTNSRNLGVLYPNDTNRTISVYIDAITTGVVGYVDGVIGLRLLSIDFQVGLGASMEVPKGSDYQVDGYVTPGFDEWSEIR